MSGVEIGGAFSPNHFIGLDDNTRLNIHNNRLPLNSPSVNNPFQDFADAIISVDRFQSGVPFNLNAGAFYDNFEASTAIPVTSV